MINNKNKKVYPIKTKGRVYVAVSGGVDSSVSAALLCGAGYDVTGVFIKAWQPDFVECTWSDDRRDAMRVASILNIPFKTIDLEKEYKKNVIDYMLFEYKNGRTPNPDVVCNERIKFGEFFKKARASGADFVATGHYARVLNNGDYYALLTGKDAKKDQSYFLWKLNQEHLQYTLFPIGGHEKSKVRELAEKFGLPTANKKDSQGLCFVGKLDFKKFLKEFINVKEGDVLNTDGGVIGKHDGVELYTNGERHGFTITKKTPNDEPYYVIGKNFKKNELIVAHKKDILSHSKKEIKIVSVNWAHSEPKENKQYKARLRYREELQNCVVKKEGGDYKIIFDRAQNPAEGQSLVIYDGEECVGGGVIAT